MKITIDIPVKELREAMRHTGARSRREAVIIALIDFNRRQRLHCLAEQFGTLERFLTQEDLRMKREGK